MKSYVWIKVVRIFHIKIFSNTFCSNTTSTVKIVSFEIDINSNDTRDEDGELLQSNMIDDRLNLEVDLNASFIFFIGIFKITLNAFFVCDEFKVFPSKSVVSS